MEGSTQGWWHSLACQGKMTLPKNHPAAFPRVCLLSWRASCPGRGTTPGWCSGCPAAVASAGPAGMGRGPRLAALPGRAAGSPLGDGRPLLWPVGGVSPLEVPTLRRHTVGPREMAFAQSSTSLSLVLPELALKVPHQSPHHRPRQQIPLQGMGLARWGNRGLEAEA